MNDVEIKAAYNEGVTAYANGFTPEDNPYSERDQYLKWQAWVDGACEAWELAQEVFDAYGY